MQWGGLRKERKILNAKKNIGEKTNELVFQKNKQKDEIKKSEIDACTNKEQQVPEDQQAAKSAMEHAKEQERVHTAQKYIEILSDSSSSSSSDDLSETSLDDPSDSSTRKKTTKPVSSSNKSSTFQAKRKSDNEEIP